ncbi:hypothetical protein IPA_08115 [Ignicoccus pacificus DSM 13166]|uniref:Uncharacterized protein n=1 Tax=Ignicoccus pacificus DSM 13166 TaxID=940294 RepID=A0A977PL83_9CREN|nr:hypothetical protein IPA_08115 [Ignicoccus pacificus DSM 13166]
MVKSVKRVRIRFTKAKWPSKAFAEIMNAVAEQFPDSEVLLVRAGQSIPILDINVYVEDLSDNQLKELEKRILNILTDHDISHVIYKKMKVFDVEEES